jgi:hypothetical protein
MTDYELTHTQYGHPEQKTGMHTNGPANIFVRQGSGNWYFVEGVRSVHYVKRMIDYLGFSHFIDDHCVEVRPNKGEEFNSCWRRFNGP